MSWRTKILKQGDSGEDVRVLRSILCSQGFHSQDLHPTHFGESTHDQVIAFQASHIDPRSRRQLVVDGIVGPATERALDAPSGEAQANGYAAVIPDGLPTARFDYCARAVDSHREGTREIPDGSNWGDGVSKILANAGGARPWCCHATSHWFKQATGAYPLGKDHGGVQKFWKAAKAKGMAFEVGTYKPVPGDLFVILYTNSRGSLTGTGHIGLVLTRSGSRFNGIEGNAGNRVKATLRSAQSKNLVGFINLFGDAEKPPKFKQGLLARTDNLDGRTR